MDMLGEITKLEKQQKRMGWLITVSTGLSFGVLMWAWIDTQNMARANDVKCAEIIAAAIRETKPAPVVPRVPPDPWTVKPPAIHTFPAPTTVTLPSAMPSWYVPVPALVTTTTAEDCGWAERGAK